MFPVKVGVAHGQWLSVNRFLGRMEHASKPGRLVSSEWLSCRIGNHSGNKNDRELFENGRSEYVLNGWLIFVNRIIHANVVDDR